MIYFLIIGVLGFIVSKFIYDSYLTDNTEKKWEEHQNRIIKQITNGYYKGNFNLEYGGTASFVLFFLNKKYAFFADKETIEKLNVQYNNIGLSKIGLKLKQQISEIQKNEKSWLDGNLGKYDIDNANFKLKLFNLNDEFNLESIEPKVYLELSGLIKNDKILLNVYSNSYNFQSHCEDDLFKKSLEHKNVELKYFKYVKY